uniref:Uncharacterized protein n=1 Tax=Panagrolaimus sp. PS1159 TaxID=55785 RepID=A0AC35GC98_9BILA
MPHLIHENFFDIGKKLVEDGDLDAITKFAFSGKKPLQVMKEIFASATFLDLREDYYSIGWGGKCFCKVPYQNDEPPLKFLMNCIGDSVVNLTINYSLSRQRIYQSVIDKIVKKKKLHTFSLPEQAPTLIKIERTFLDEFLPQFSTTLKHVTIPSVCMTPKLRDSINLESITVLDQFTEQLPIFCCKTKSLQLGLKKTQYPNQSFEQFVVEQPQISFALVSIKLVVLQITIYDYEINRMILTDLTKYFPSLETIKIIIPLNTKFFVFHFLRFYMPIIRNSVKVPPKIEIDFCKHIDGMKWRTLEQWKNAFKYCEFDESFKYFELDESVSEFYCFRESIQSAGPGSTIFEVQIPK